MLTLNHHLSWQRLVFFMTEGLLVFASIVLAMAMRFSFELAGLFAREMALSRAILATLICQLCLYYNDLYGEEVARQAREILIKILQALAGASAILFAIYYFYPDLGLGRGIFVLTLVILPLLLTSWRLFYTRYIGRAFRTRVLIIGTDGLGKSLGQELIRRPDLGYEVVGYIDQDPNQVGVSVFNPRVVGDYQTLPDVITKDRVENVIVALDDRRGRLPLEALLASRLRGVRIEDGVSFYERISGKIAVAQLRPSWLIFSEGFRKSWFIRLVKRLEDLALGIAGLVVLSPLFLALAILVRVTSPGPVFYRQQRVGEGGKVFTLYKFRSMRADAEAESGPVWASHRDPRVTPVGRWMRKLRLDELPQLVNVLKGEMSFVGPRPERPEFVDQLRKEIPYYDLRFSVKPGITGWAQVRYHYGGTVEGAFEKLQYELYYIKNMSLVLDFIILVDTVKVVLFQRGAL